MQIKQRIKYSPHFAGIRSVQHLLQRYALYASLVILGIFVAGNNIFARTIRPDEIGQGAVWTTLAQSENSDVIVETGLSQPISSTASTTAIGGLPPTPSDQVTPDSQVLATQIPETTTTVGGTQEVSTDKQGIQTYTVQGGDTVSTIAAQFNIGSQTLLWANGLGATDYIKPGQVLKVPPTDGYLYTVKSGDTVTGIAKKYGGTEDEILKANGLPLAEAIQAGQDIIIPGGQPIAPPTPSPTFSQPQSILQRVFVRNVPPSSNATSRGLFIWPTPNHHINQYYRGRWHTGLDIEGDYSSPIYAAAAGRVTFAAFDRSGYGLHIIIDNAGAYSTLYGHASKIFVHVGEQVSRGQTIAMIGSTGRSTGTHLHFEIRVGSVPTNPLSYF